MRSGPGAEKQSVVGNAPGKTAYLKARGIRIFEHPRQAEPFRDELRDKTCPQVSRIRKRLRVHGLLKRAGVSCEHSLTRMGRLVLSAGPKRRELFIAPQFHLRQLSEN